MNLILKTTACTAAVCLTLLVPAVLSWALASLAILAMSTQPAYPQSRSGQELFQQALAMERAQGKLAEAIALYQRVVAEHSNDRALSARALVQIGRCHERMGSKAAKAAYERVVREFGDQTGSAAVARNRLTTLKGADKSATGAAATLHLLATLPPDSLETVSDGQYAVFERYMGGSRGLEALEIRSGKTWRVRPGDADMRYPASALIPPVHFGGSAAHRPMLAYSRGKGWNPQGVFLSNLDGSGERLLLNRAGQYCSPAFASPSAPGLLPVNCFKPVANGSETTFAIVNIRDSAVVSEGSLPAAGPLPTGASMVSEVSPGGKHLVVASGGDIFLTDLQGRVIHPLVQHPSLDHAPAAFVNNGAQFCWGSDRTGVVEVWCQPMNGLRASGKPYRLSGANFPTDSRGAGFDHLNNRLFYVQERRRGGLLFGRLDEHGKLAEPLSDAPGEWSGSTLGGSWTSDGKYFGVVQVTPGVWHSTYTILLRDEATGVVKRVPLPSGLRAVWGFNFAPDGKSAGIILYFGDRNELAVIDIPGGGIRKTITRKGPGHPGDLKFCEPGKLNVFETMPGRGRTVQIDIESGHEREMPFGVHACAGPGKVTTGGPPTGGSGRDHILLDIATGAKKLIAPSAVVSGLSPDARVAVYTRKVGDKWHLFRRFVDSGAEEKIAELTAQQTSGVRFHPDGRRFVVVAGSLPTRELWQMTVNFGGGVTSAGK